MSSSLAFRIGTWIFARTTVLASGIYTEILLKSSNVLVKSGDLKKGISTNYTSRNGCAKRLFMNEGGLLNERKIIVKSE